METRIALDADAQTLASLHAESFGDAAWNMKQITGSLSLPTTLAFAAEDEGKTVGFLMCQLSGDDFEILTFCVTPCARRKGFGEKLLNRAKELAKKRNLRKIFLEVSSHNVAALSLYAKAGFVKIGTRREYYSRNGNVSDAIMLAYSVTQGSA